MSKTLGNVIDPLDTIKEYGTDALRFTIALGTAGQVCFVLTSLMRQFCMSLIQTLLYFTSLADQKYTYAVFHFCMLMVLSLYQLPFWLIWYSFLSGP